MNVSSLSFLSLDSSVFGLLVLKNRFIAVGAVSVVFVLKLQICVCVRERVRLHCSDFPSSYRSVSSEAFHCVLKFKQKTS